MEVQIGFVLNVVEETDIQTALAQFATHQTQTIVNVKHKDLQSVMNGSVQHAEK